MMFVDRPGVRYLSLAALAGAVLLAGGGCGVVLTAAGLGAIAASGKSKSGQPGAPNVAPTVPTAAVVGDTSGGSVSLDFTITDPESDPAPLEFRYSLDPNEAATKSFAKTATGTLAAASGGQVTAAATPTSPGGIAYRFVWSSANDLGATRSEAVRLQIVTPGVAPVGSTQSTYTVLSTTGTFVADNTGAPLVASAVPGALPAGATVYADDQSGGSIPIALTVADAEATPASLKVLFSTDGGATFPESNVAVGKLVDGSGTSVPMNQVPTSAAGLGYTFRFVSKSNGLGTAGREGVVLRFVASDTKTGAPRDTAVFGVNNAAFTALLGTPSASQITDKVFLGYLLFDDAGEALDVRFEYQLSPAASFAAATPAAQPPATGTAGQSATSAGAPHGFFWNAFQDMVVRTPPVPASPSAVVRLFVTRPSTAVTKGPFPTNPFSVDHRLIETVLGKNSGSLTNLPAQTTPIGRPAGIAMVGKRLTVGLRDADLVVAVDTTTNTLDTVAGGGTSGRSGDLATDFALREVAAVAAASNGSGAFFISDADPSSFVNPRARVLRVDGSTPIVTRLVFEYDGTPGDLAYEPLNDRVVCVLQPAVGAAQLRIVQSSGLLVANGGGAAGAVPGYGGPDAGNNATIVPSRVSADFNVAPNLIFFTEETNRRVLVWNVGGGPQTIFGKVVGSGRFATVLDATTPGFGAFAAADPDAPLGVAVTRTSAGAPSLAMTFPNSHRVGRVPIGAAVPALTFVAGRSFVAGFAGDLGPAGSSILNTPDQVTWSGVNGELVFADSGNERVRRIDAGGTIATLAGTFGLLGDGGPCALAKLGRPTSVIQTAGGFLVADAALGRVRRVDSASGNIGTFAGFGESGETGNLGSPTLARLGSPCGLARDPATGDVYVSQRDESVVRVVKAATIDHAAGVLNAPGTFAVVAGGVPAATAPLRNPQGLAWSSGCLVIGQPESAGGANDGTVVAMNPGNAAAVVCGVAVNPASIVHVAGSPAGGGVAPPAPGAPGVLATTVNLNLPVGVCAASNGDLFLADASLCAIFKIEAATGLLTTVSGTLGTNGFRGDGGAYDDTGLLTSVLYDAPVGVAVEERLGVVRAIYVLDASNSRVRALNLTGAALTVSGTAINAGQVRTIAGTGAAAGSLGDGGPATAARLDLANDLGSNMLVDGNGDAVRTGTFYFPDHLNRRIRFIDPAGTIRTFTGLAIADGDGGAAANARLSRPTALVAGGDGSYLVADLGRIRYVSPGTTTVSRAAGNAQQRFAGDAAASATNASFSYTATENALADVLLDGNGPRQLALLDAGAVSPVPLLAIADTRDHAVRIMNLSRTTSVTLPTVGLTIGPLEIKRVGGSVQVVAGFEVPQPGYTGDGQVVSGTAITPPGPPPPNITSFNSPEGVAFSAGGLLLVSDTGNGAIRAINLTAADIVLPLPVPITVESGRIRTILSGLVEPRALATFESGAAAAVIFQQGNAASTPGANARGIHVFNAGAGPLAKWNLAALASGSYARIGIYGNAGAATVGDGDTVRGVAADRTTGDVYCCATTQAPPNSLGPTVVRIASAGGFAQPIAGTVGSAGFSGDGGVAALAELDAPFGVSLDGRGSIYILDGQNFRVRRCRLFP